MKQTFKQIFIGLVFLLTNCLISELVYGQVPQKFNYQGIARDAIGNPMGKQQLALKLSVLPTSDATVAEYEETQLVTTNEFGLYTLQIGNGTAVTGNMKTVKWETGNKYIKVAIDPQGGSNYLDAGTSQLLSVPYAIYADKAGVSATTAGSAGGTRTGAVNSNAAHVVGDANYITKFTALNTIGKSLLYDNGSAVGLGTTTPVATAKFHIFDASAAVTEMRIQHTNQTGGASRLSFFNDANTGFTATANYAVMNKYAAGIAGSPVAPGYPLSKLFGFNNSQGSLLFSSGGNVGFGQYNQATSTVTVRLHIDSATGNIGIGTVTPGAKLEVNGQIKITGGTPVAGKVLTSDNIGLASWQNIPVSIGDIVGFVRLQDAFGNNVYTNLANTRVTLDGISGVIATTTTDINGRYQFTNVSTGTYSIAATKTGYGTDNIDRLSFVGGGIPTLVSSITIGQIPVFTLATLTAAQNGTSVVISGTINGATANKSTIGIYIGSSSTTSSNTNNYIAFKDVSTGTNSSAFALTLTQQVLLDIGIPSGSTMYFMAYPINTGNSTSSGYTDINNGRRVLTAVGAVGVAASVIVP